MSAVRELKTNHLKLRQWKEGDFLPFAKMNANPAVMEYYPSTLSEDKYQGSESKYSGLIFSIRVNLSSEFDLCHKCILTPTPGNKNNVDWNTLIERLKSVQQSNK